MTVAKRARLGDIVELKTGKGLAYAQYSHESKLGGVLRVLQGFYPSRPVDWETVAAQSEAFITLMAVRAAVARGLLEVVGHAEIPEAARPFPLFRAPQGFPDPRTGRVSSWWLWDGERGWPIEVLTADLHRLPIREAWGIPVLLERVEAEWRPELDASTIGDEETLRRPRPVEPAQEPVVRVQHFLSFPTRALAHAARTVLLKRGYSAELRAPAVETKSWQLTARPSDGSAGDDLETQQEQLERLAEEFGGEYDGHDVGV